MEARLGQLGAIPLLTDAFFKVKSNGGGPGIDGVTAGQFRADLDRQIQELSDSILTGSYRPLPLKSFGIKQGKKERVLAIGSIRDRVVERALSEMLYPLIEPLLTPASYAFRKGRGARQAVRKLRVNMEKGLNTVFLSDVYKFFDHIQIDMVMDDLKRIVSDDGLLNIIRILLENTRMRDMRFFVPEQGIPQGSALSPLLSNLYLNEFDKSMIDAGFELVRYCDDFAVPVENQARAMEARELADALLKQKGLLLHPAKSRFVKKEDSFDFLGFRFGNGIPLPAAKAVEALKHKLITLGRNRNASVKELEITARGWVEYFGIMDLSVLYLPEGLLVWMMHPEWFLPMSQRVRPEEWHVKQGIQPRQAWVHLTLTRMLAGRGMLHLAWKHFLADWDDPKLGNVSIICRAIADALGFKGDVRLCDLRMRLMSGRSGLEKGLEEIKGAGNVEAARIVADLYGHEHEKTEKESPVPVVRDGVKNDMTPEDKRLVELILKMFTQGTGRYVRYQGKAGGTRAYQVVYSPVTRETLLSHFKGEPIGIPVLREDSTLTCARVDMRVKQDAHVETEDHDKQLMHYALKFRAVLKDLGCESLLERSGNGTLRVWLIMEKPVPAVDMKRFIDHVLSTALTRPACVRLGLHPFRTRIKADADDDNVDLPLGKCQVTGRSAQFLDARGNAVDAISVLSGYRPISPEGIRKVINKVKKAAGSIDESSGLGTQLSLEKTERLNLMTSPFGDRDYASFADMPGVLKILKNCPVMLFLVRKAMYTGLLSQQERSAILYVLGFLPENGSTAIHKIMQYTFNYSKSRTDRAIRTRKESPISCARLRENFPQVTSRVNCSCRFNTGRNAYPSPLLHALAIMDIKVFAKREENRVKGLKRTHAAEAAEAQRIIARVAEMKRQVTAINRTIDGLIGRLDMIFDALDADRLPMKDGVLVKTAREDGKNSYHLEI